MRLLPYLMVLLVCTLSGKAARHASLQWSMSLDKQLLDISNVSEDHVSIFLQNNETYGGCLYDVMNLTLHSRNTARAFLHDLLLAVIQDRSATKIPVATILPIFGDEQKAPLSSLLTCSLNEAHCRPQIENIVANTRGNPSIQVSFTDETNMPDLSSTFQLLEALVFTPVLLGGAIGEWTDNKTLVIMIDTVYLDAIMEGYNRGDIMKVDIRNTVMWGVENEDDLQITLRPQEHGRYQIFTVNSTTMRRNSPMLTYDVRHCSSGTLIPHSVPDGKFDLPIALPAVSMKGLLAINGHDSITIPQDVVQSMVDGSWSLSLYIQLLTAPTGAYRTLFFKGTTDSPQRTPSAWLLPTTNRFALRLSTENNHDVGADTYTELSAGSSSKWSFLTFVFSNDSANRGLLAKTKTGMMEPSTVLINPSNANYTVSAYVNGQLDISIGFADSVVGNHGPLRLFKDDSHDGPLSFVADVIIWDAPLSKEQIQGIYTAGPSTPTMLYDDDLQSTIMAAVSVPASNDKAALSLLQQAKDGFSSCSLGPLQRLDLLSESSSHGSAEALYRWGMLVAFGSEESQSACGYDESSSSAWLAAVHNNDQQSSTIGVPNDQARAVRAFVRAVEGGYSPALVPIALSLLTGIGVDSILEQHGTKEEDLFWDIPSPPVSSSSSSSSTSVGLLHALARAVSDGTNECHGRKPTTSFYQQPPPQYEYDLRVGYSVLCPAVTFSSDGITQLAIRLLHISSLYGAPEADAMLAFRYQHGLGVIKDVEIAAQYARRASVVSADNFHRVGAQPILESDRINDDTERDVDKGNKGNDDEIIAYQRVRADEGDVDAQVALGDLYYYGARGLPRDQPMALHYYLKAAAVHFPMGLCGAAAMYLKGEGSEKNVSRAVELYSEAAALGSVKALNGLGYLYFYGDAVPKNESKAFHYFIAATEHSLDGDSFTNAAFCLEKGIGVEKDVVRAAQLYDVAARKFGSFGGINALGNMYMEGIGVPRSATQALFFTTAAIGVGPWAGWLRRGFDSYLIGTRSRFSTVIGGSLRLDMSLRRSLFCYLYAAEFGFEVAGANAAFILRRKLNTLGNVVAVGGSDGTPMSFDFGLALQLRQLALSAHHGRSDAFVGIGNLFYLYASQTADKKMMITDHTTTTTQFLSWMMSFSDIMVVSSSPLSNNDMDHTDEIVHQYQTLSVWWYSKASAAGDALGSIYSGMMVQMGIGVPKRNPLRAQRYFKLALHQHKQGAPLHRLVVIVLNMYLQWCTWWN